MNRAGTHDRARSSRRGSAEPLTPQRHPTALIGPTRGHHRQHVVLQLGQRVEWVVRGASPRAGRRRQ